MLPLFKRFSISFFQKDIQQRGFTFDKDKPAYIDIYNHLDYYEINVNREQKNIGNHISNSFLSMKAMCAYDFRDSLRLLLEKHHYKHDIYKVPDNKMIDLKEIYTRDYNGKLMGEKCWKDLISKVQDK
jgi:hypothetical protein